MDSTKYLGVEERILQEQKDFSREVEDIQRFDDIFGNSMPIESVLTINEQISNVQEFKNLSPE